MQTLHLKHYPRQLSKYNVVCQCGHHIASYSKAFHGRIAHNINFFGKVEDLQIQIDSKGRFAVWNSNRQLTNITFTKN